MEAFPDNQKPNLQNKNESTANAAFVFWSLLGALLIFVDQLAKHFAKALVFRNFYFAFSLPVPMPIMYGIYGIALALIALHIKKYWRTFFWRTRLAWTLIVAGALSNIIERIVLGYVRDFIYISTGVFNFADGYIILGVLLLFFSTQKVESKK